MSWLESLLASKKKKKRVVIGLMSGTSVNSVDAAVCEIQGFGPVKSEVKLLGFYSHPFPDGLRSRVVSAANLNLGQLAELNLRLGELFARAALAAIKRYGKFHGKVDLIGSHGQTVYHHSGLKDAPHASLQLAEGDSIAALTGTPVVADFRVKDLILGGEGAPLTPYADYILFKHELEPKHGKLAVLNLGGIANITLLSKDPEKTNGFDLGPANSPLDRVACILSSGRKRFDQAGNLARGGKVNQKTLKQLLVQDRFLERRPPKSTGTEAYGDAWVKHFLKLCKESQADRMATVTEFVAQGICLSIKKHVLAQQKISKLIIAGGGVKNSFLLERIRKGLQPLQVVVSDQVGVPAQAREAMAFAIFANDMLAGFSTSLKSVTGARRCAVLGKLSIPQ